MTDPNLEAFNKLRDELYNGISDVLGNGAPEFRIGENVTHVRHGKGKIIFLSINAMRRWVYRVDFGKPLTHPSLPDDFRWARNMDGTRPIDHAPKLTEIDMISGMIKRDIISQLGDLADE